ncbi:MAG: ABC transporter ATP-binding protein [Parvularculaceae bacterium]|nr:ABC transporter ATP-binding protein [Parvularculaceae bacterium]
MTDLVASGITVKAPNAVLVRDASFSLKPGELVALLGPNGAGKTSLIRATLGLAELEEGEATLGGLPTADLSPMKRARMVSYLPQTRPLAWPNLVRDVVSLGRFSHGVALGRLNAADESAVSRALDACDLTDLAGRRTDTLSGGELARVHCARAFAAEAPLLIADEPVTALDPRHQIRIIDLVAQFVAAGGGALVVLHDVQLAARYASRLIFMKDGKIVVDGPLTDILTADRLLDVYGIRARVEGRRVDIEGAA